MIRIENYYIAYLDILGYKDIIKKDKNNIFLKNLKHIFTNLETSVEFSNIFSKDSNFKFKIFSDNIVICHKVTKEEINDKKIIASLISFLGALQGFLLLYGYTSRGGITSGELYWDDLFLYGNGLVDVYELENKIAKYPRVVVDKALATLYEELRINSRSNKYPKLLKEKYYYIDFYKYIKPNSKNFPQKKIEEKYKEYTICTKQKIKKKLEWIIKYHNSCCQNTEFDVLKITPIIIK